MQPFTTFQRELRKKNCMIRLSFLGFVSSSLLILLSACFSSNVANEGLFQKRKYTSGCYVKTRSLVQSETKENDHRAEKMELRQVGNPTSNLEDKNTTADLSQTYDSSPHVFSTGIYANDAFKNSVKQKGSGEYTTMTIKGNNPFPSSGLRRQNRSVWYGKQDSRISPSGEVDDSNEETNKVSVYSFAFFIFSLALILFGSFLALSGMNILLLLGIVFFITSLVLAILALTKYKHQQKRKVFAKITVYLSLFIPILILIIGLITLAVNGDFSYKF